jgi:hypothetical protein
MDLAMPLARNKQQQQEDNKKTEKYKRIDNTQKRIAEKNKEQVGFQIFLIEQPSSPL